MCVMLGGNLIIIIIDNLTIKEFTKSHDGIYSKQFKIWAKDCILCIQVLDYATVST